MSYSTSHCSVENSVENMIRWSIKDWWFLWNTLHVHTLSVIMTITAVSMATNVSHRRIHRSWAVHRAIIRRESMHRTLCTVQSKIVVLMCVLFFGRWRVKIGHRVRILTVFGQSDEVTMMHLLASLGATTWTMKMKPTIRMARQDPNWPMTARLGGGLTIWCVYRPFLVKIGHLTRELLVNWISGLLHN